MVLRTVALVALVASAGGCKQSLFDNNVDDDGTGSNDGGNGSNDGNNMVASMCPTGCVGDAAADVDGSRPGWRYLEDARNRTWSPMTGDSGTYAGAVSPNAITTCAANPTAPGCIALPGALLVTTAGATTGADPAIEFTATKQVVQLSLRVYVPTGQPDQQIRLYRNSREDSLVTTTAMAGQLLERAITVDALLGDRFLLAVAPSAMGAENVAVHFYINATGESFPKDCSLALQFSTLTGNTVPNECGSPATFHDYDLPNPDDIPPVLGAGPFAELGMGADVPLTDYYTTNDVMPRTGDTTTQMWIKHDAFDPSFSYNAVFFSDIDLNATGGLEMNIFEDTGGARGLGVYTCDTATQTTFTVAGDDLPYPNDANWHFIRVVHTNGQVRVCVDGTRVGSFVVPATKLQSPRKPMLGRNQVWTPAGAFFDGGIDDVRSIAGALPCDP